MHANNLRACCRQTIHCFSLPRPHAKIMQCKIMLSLVYYYVLFHLFDALLCIA